MLYTCPATGPKNDSYVRPRRVRHRVRPSCSVTSALGDHGRSQVAYLRIGPVGMMWLPAEMLAESTIGLPAGYHDEPGDWHEDDLSLHASGAAYVTSRYVKNRMDDEYRWVVGLGNDELGYAVPLADYRVLCVADELAGPGTCAALHAAGCHRVPRRDRRERRARRSPRIRHCWPRTARRPPAIAGSCRYGQAFGEAEDHYEETNSLGWDLEADILRAVGAITGDDDPATVNPAFPGWWMGHTPPT